MLPPLATRLIALDKLQQNCLAGVTGRIKELFSKCIKLSYERFKTRENIQHGSYPTQLMRKAISRLDRASSLRPLTTCTAQHWAYKKQPAKADHLILVLK